MKGLGIWGSTQQFGGEVHDCRHTGKQLASFSVCENHCTRGKLSNHQRFCCRNPNRQSYIRRTRKKLVLQFALLILKAFQAAKDLTSRLQLHIYGKEERAATPPAWDNR